MQVYPHIRNMENKSKNYRILVVDDEDSICDILQYNLLQAGYSVDTANSAEEALYKLKGKYDLLLLDIMLDGINGFKLAKLLRHEYHNNIPIIFISALDTEPDILSGFDAGGDDYISKPFSVKEVLARVKAVLSRSEKNAAMQPGNTPAAGGTEEAQSEGPAKITVHDLVIDCNEHRVYIKGKEIFLTKKENDILVLLVKYPNKIFSRDDILKLVWKNESFVLDRTVDVHIARLRKKRGNYGDMIINRSGYGYCFQP